jgi:hypothetical protein
MPDSAAPAGLKFIIRLSPLNRSLARDRFGLGAFVFGDCAEVILIGPRISVCTRGAADALFDRVAVLVELNVVPKDIARRVLGVLLALLWGHHRQLASGRRKARCDHETAH